MAKTLGINPELLLSQKFPEVFLLPTFKCSSSTCINLERLFLISFVAQIYTSLDGMDCSCRKHSLTLKGKNSFTVDLFLWYMECIHCD